MKEKIFKGYILCNWRTGKSRLLMKNPHFLNPFEIKVPFNIKITLPEIKDTPLNIDLQLPTVDTTEIKM